MLDHRSVSANSGKCLRYCAKWGATACIQLNGARQHVSNWATDNLNIQVELPSGFLIESILGQPISKPADLKTEPSIEVAGGIRFDNADLSRATLVIQSPGGTATATHTTTTTQCVDMEALQALVKLLTEKIGELQAAGHPASEFADLEEPLNELRELGQMPTPKPGWVLASLKSLKTVLEGAAGSVLGELAKPHVQVLITHLMANLGR